MQSEVVGVLRSISVCKLGGGVGGEEMSVEWESREIIVFLFVKIMERWILPILNAERN